ncbi:Very-long-chain (3R)-3-hydroxyacyl-CoA dehydratase 3 [Chionoecetes opilio]|uniref:Very-long-chain (3R)-3-hydroxyacyl-CoA dehydratase n=1 Tax=Chionoecetes opilio TaxID=41210 RepID=A0A8J5CQ56_CHIOP|nr:Very-long-chain (3R)-3-hydroxyacyl-CoA dehydratase 3 [Chionoecetes opilio]
MEEEPTLSPFVYWAQTDATITLRIELRNVQSPQVELEEQQLSFLAVGHGAQGEKKYAFTLSLLRPIDTETSRFRVLERNVEFSLNKAHVEFWPRLLEDTRKPAWLKIDFDKWTHEEDLSDETRDINDDFPGLYEKMQAEELGYPSKRENLKKVYLFLYNLWQFVGFFYLTVVTCTRYLKEGQDSMAGTYAAVGWMMRLCLLTQLLEVLHPIVGYTRGSVLPALVQVFGRSVIFFCLIESEERMQTKPAIFYLFLVWSFIELVRYPYYMLRVYEADNGFITWLRYTLWIPLYPLGFILEGAVIIRSIPYFEETGKFSVSLPNSINFGFYFPNILRSYILLFFFPAMYKMMNHMYQQRKQKLGPHTKTKKLQ